ALELQLLVAPALAFDAAAVRCRRAAYPVALAGLSLGAAGADVEDLRGPVLAGRGCPEPDDVAGGKLRPGREHPGREIAGIVAHHRDRAEIQVLLREDARVIVGPARVAAGMGRVGFERLHQPEHFLVAPQRPRRRSLLARASDAP